MKPDALTRGVITSANVNGVGRNSNPKNVISTFVIHPAIVPITVYHAMMTAIRMINSLCPSCTLAASMRDCLACQDWYKRIFAREVRQHRQDTSLKPVKMTGNAIKADDKNSEFSIIQKIQGD